MHTRTTQRLFPELSYASDSHSHTERLFIRTVEAISGRHRFAALYDVWSREIFPSGERVFQGMLDLLEIELLKTGPVPAPQPQSPLVVVANHPFGIGDGIAILALAESLGRPFRVMIHSELLKIREMTAYALPIDFSETKEAARRNIEVRHEALRLLKAGTTIVAFPAGGVATAPRGVGRAQDLPWKLFPARLIQDGRAAVLPVHFGGQNGPLFHLASRLSQTARTSLLIHEFSRLSGKAIDMRIGRIMTPDELSSIRDRNALIHHLRGAVFALDPAAVSVPAGRWLPPRWREPRHPDCAPRPR